MSQDEYNDRAEKTLFKVRWISERAIWHTNGRPLLSHLVWEDAQGRPVPHGQTVIHLDGNKNNLDPTNLALRSRADCARMNIPHPKLNGAEREAFFERIAAARAASRARQ